MPSYWSFCSVAKAKRFPRGFERALALLFRGADEQHRAAVYSGVRDPLSRHVGVLLDPINPNELPSHPLRRH
jgi:hypothetical protein